MTEFFNRLVMAIGTRTGYWTPEELNETDNNNDDEMLDAIAEAPRPDLLDGITIHYSADGCWLNGTETKISAVADHLGLPVHASAKHTLALSCQQTIELVRHGILSFQKP